MILFPRQNLSHVRRFRDVFAVAEDVHRILARCFGVVAHIGRAIAVVVALDLGLRRAFNAESYFKQNLSIPRAVRSMNQMITKCSVVAVSFDGEKSGLADDSAVQSRTEHYDLRLLVGSDVDFERRFRDLVTAVRDHDDVAALLARIVHGLGGVLVDLAKFHRLIDSARSDHADVQLTLARSVGVDAEIGSVADADAVRLEAAA